MQRQPGSHGAPGKNPALYNVDTFSNDRMDESADGRFGRMFVIADGAGGQDGLRMLPHPSTKYDLRKLGALDGPMNPNNGPINPNSGPGNPDSLAPAGITFLGQFVDHDITLDVSSKFSRPQINAALENGRTPNLDLDCVYGGGREASPYLYQNSGEVWERAKLIEGPVIGGATAGQRDLHRNNDGGTPGGGRAIIGDPRNDENIFVAQVQAAFIRFHNQCVDLLHTPPTDSSGNPRWKAYESDEELFERARDTATHYYHRIILEDLLYRLIGLDMMQAIATQGRMYYFPNGFTKADDTWPERPFMPVEFSVAAYRYGHTTVRESYAVNGPLDTPLFDANLRGFHKIPDNFHMDWEWFFVEQNRDPQQFAQKIDPFLPTPLFELPDFAGSENSLASRNLMRGRIFRLPSGEAIARRMYADGMKISATQDMREEDIIGLHTDAPQHIEQMITKMRTEYAMNETPLWLYVLLEGAIYGKGFHGDQPPNKEAGDRLGPVGGRIVGEVLMGLMDHYRDSTGKGLDYDPDIPSNVPDGVQLAGMTFGPRMSMRALINFGYGLESGST